MAKPEKTTYPESKTPQPEGEVVFGTDREHKCAACQGTVREGGDVLVKTKPVIDQLLVDGKISLQQGTTQTWQHYPECPVPEEGTNTIQ